MMSLQLISKHRPVLMGFALIWVMLYHIVGQGECTSVPKAFLALGHAGVDVFFFLSGFGLTYSYYDKLKTKKEIKKYLKKRILRIIPSYYCIIIIAAIAYNKDIGDILWQITCIGFWIGKPAYDWYVPSLLVFYSVFPLFVFLAHRHSIYKAATAFILIALLGTIALVWVGRGTVILFLSRIPVLFLGCIFGYTLKYKHSDINQLVWWSLISLAVALFVIEIFLTCKFSATYLRITALHHLPFVLIIPGFCLVASYISEYLSNSYFGKWIIVCLSFVGTYSLEIYLAHMSLRFTPFYIYIPLAIAFGYFISKIVNTLTRKLICPTIK